MNLDQIEDLIRRYLAAGTAVVVILVGPVTGAPADPGAGTSTAQPGAVDPADEEVDVRDGTPGADGDPDPTTAPAPGGAGEPADGSTDPDDGERTDAGAPRGDEPGDTDRVPPDPTDPDPTDPDPTDPDPTDPDPTDPDPTGPDPANPDSAGPDLADPDLADPDLADPDPTSPDPTSPPGEAGTAAELLGWGPPERVDDFLTADLDGWELYTGRGYQGRGERSPDALAVGDGVLTISGDARGTTGGACWGGGRRYGRWEARVRAPAADPAYHALLLLWPDADDFPAGGQVDFLELTDPARASAEFHLHSGDGDRVRSEVRVDATRWHDWAVEWTPEAITGHLDGERWFASTDPSTLPPGPMHLCVQLDFFPTGDAEVRPSRMDVDWVRQYAPDGGTAVPEPVGPRGR